jgi:hypothetical protein
MDTQRAYEGHGLAMDTPWVHHGYIVGTPLGARDGNSV